MRDDRVHEERVGHELRQLRRPQVGGDDALARDPGGVDAGEGLDVRGSFLYAVDIGGTGGQTVGDARFTDDSSQPGFTVSAENVIPSWGDAIQLGDSADDDALGAGGAGVHRFASAPPDVEGGLGRRHKLRRGSSFAVTSRDKEAAREIVYGMPYDDWKAKYQTEATADQQAAFEKNKPQH